MVVDHWLAGGSRSTLAGRVLLGAARKENALSHGQFDLLDSIDVDKRIGDTFNDNQTVRDHTDYYPFFYRDAEKRINTVVYASEHKEN